MQLDQSILNYTEEHLEDYRKRQEEFAHKVFDFTIEEHGKRPELYNKSKIHLQYEVAKFIRDNYSEFVKEEELKAEWIVQRAIITIEMLHKMAEDERAKKRRKN